MKVKVIYLSRKGNTKKLAEAIANGAGAKPENLEEQGNALGKVDILFVGASIYGGKIDKRIANFIQYLDEENVKKVVVFGTSAGSKTALPEVKELLKGKKITVAEKGFFCKGSFLLAHIGHPNAADFTAAKAFGAEAVK